MYKIVLIFLLALAGDHAHSDEASHRDKTEYLTSIDGSAAIIASITEALEFAIEQFGNELYEDLVTQNFDSPDIYGRIIEFEEEAIEVIRREFSYESWAEEFVPMRMAYFNETEVEQLIEFYESDIGKALVERTPQMMQQSAEIGDRMTARYMKAIQPIEAKLLRDLGLEQ